MQNEQSEYTDVPEKGLFFVPLGGVGEIGINFCLYACDGKWIAVDCGVGFAGDRLPGVDMVLPDPSFAEKISKNLIYLCCLMNFLEHFATFVDLFISK